MSAGIDAPLQVYRAFPAPMEDDVIQRPRLKSFLTLFPLSETVWGLRGSEDEVWRLKLKDERALHTFSRLLLYLDGRHSRPEILEALEAREVDRIAAEQLLAHLEKSGLIEEADDAGLSREERERFRPQIEFFSHFSPHGGSRAQALLREVHVAVVAQGFLGRCLERQLEDAGVGRLTLLHPSNDPPPVAGSGSTQKVWSRLDRETVWPDFSPAAAPSLLFVPVEGEDPALLRAVDRFSKLHGLPWMLIQAIDPHEGWVGPLFVPGDTACYRTLETRLIGNSTFATDLRAFHRHLSLEGRPAAPAGGLFPALEVLAGMAVSDSLRYLADLGPPFLAGRFLTVSYSRWEVEVHELLRLPRLGLEAPDAPRIFPWLEAVPAGRTDG